MLINQLSNTDKLILRTDRFRLKRIFMLITKRKIIYCIVVKNILTLEVWNIYSLTTISFSQLRSATLTNNLNINCALQNVQQVAIAKTRVFLQPYEHCIRIIDQFQSTPPVLRHREFTSNSYAAVVRGLGCSHRTPLRVIRGDC